MRYPLSPVLIIVSLIVGCAAPAADSPDANLLNASTPTLDWQTATAVARQTQSEYVNATQTASMNRYLLTLQPTSTSTATLTPLPTTRPTQTPKPNEVDLVAKVNDVVAYYSNGNLCLGRQDEPPIYLTEQQQDQGSATVSPDGELVLFTIVREPDVQPPDREARYIYEEFWVMPTSGREPRLLTTNEQFKLDYPDVFGEPDRWKWIPNTHKVVFTTVRPPYREYSHIDVHLLDADTGEQQLLVPPAPEESSEWGGPLYPSPDGRYIAYLTATSLNLIGTDGQNASPNILLYDFVNTYSEYAVYATVTWASDSSGMWVTVPAAEGETTTELYFVSILGEIRPIAVLPSPERYASISPDGKHVIYYEDTLKLLSLPSLELVADFGEFSMSRWLDGTHFRLSDRIDQTTYHYLADLSGTYELVEEITPMNYPACER